MRLLLLAALAVITNAFASDRTLYYKAQTTFVASSGNTSPYYIGSNNHGMNTQSHEAYMRLSAAMPLDTASRFSFGAGVDLVGGYAGSAEYLRHDGNEIAYHNAKINQFRIHQLFADVKYRSVFLTIGAKEHESLIVNHSLSSGDLTFSGNINPMPEARMGLIDFQPLPFTRGNVFINGEYSIAYACDNGIQSRQFNRISGGYNKSYFYNYKRCYLRSRPDKPLCLTIGMQAVMVFGNTTANYSRGKWTGDFKNRVTFKSFVHTLVPGAGGSSAADLLFLEGNSLGTWDIAANYRFKNGSHLKAYYESPWEDGSGIGKMNGFDGLWGIEYSSGRKSLVNGVVIEYLDTRNQSGTITFQFKDYSGSISDRDKIPNGASGCDNYYNHEGQGYQYRCMSIGTPMLKSALYNTNGTPAFRDNRIQGVHVGVSGNLSGAVSYRLLGNFRRALGTYNAPRRHALRSYSAFAEATYRTPLAGLVSKCQLAADRGSLYGKNFGAMFTIAYQGNL